MKIAVTGATGFIGKNLCNYLQTEGHEVYAIVRSHEKGQTLKDNNISYRIADIKSIKTLETVFKDIDVVIHLAALFNNPEFTWDDYNKTNVEGTSNVLISAQKLGVKKVIHCSTVGVATGKNGAISSELSPYSPPVWDKYETSKSDGEKLAIKFNKENNYPVVIIRPAQVYGPGDESKVKFYKMVKKGIIINPGKTLKHLIFIDDLCRAFELAATKENIDGEIFIIGGNEVTPLKDLIKIVANKLKVPYPKITLPATPITWIFGIVESLSNLLKTKPPVFKRSMDFFTKSVQFDITKAKNKLDFESKVDVVSGIQKTTSWYQKNNLL